MPLNRRLFLHSAPLAAAALLAAPALARAAPVIWRSDPFSLGVASGEPRPDGFVLWTRLDPEPLLNERLTQGDLAVGYEVAADPQMRRLVRRGTARAEAQFGHSVHLEVRGLAPGRPYWYRFTSGAAASPIGRAITVPAAGGETLRFGFVSCAHYEHGFFASYRHLADERPDLVLYLGDYIYEESDDEPGLPRRHQHRPPLRTLADYRSRYAEHRLDPDLQRLHAEAPALLTWDDHETANDYAGEVAPKESDPATFRRRRAAAYQAFYEFMPVSPARSRPQGADLRLYDKFTFGDLAQIHMLDGRQYRSALPCYDPPDRGRGRRLSDAACPERLDPARSFLGAPQERWLFDALAGSRARWNVLGQNLLMAEFRNASPEGTVRWNDDWNGYPAARARLLTHLHQAKVANPVVLGGDNHAFWASRLLLDFDRETSPAVASEFVATSVSTWGSHNAEWDANLPINPHVLMRDGSKRGYAVADVTRTRMETRFRAISDAADPKATVSTLKTYVIEDGKAGPVEG